MGTLSKLKGKVRDVVAPLAKHPKVTRATARATFLGTRPAAVGRHHVLIAPPGAGNVGDYALVESFLENVDGEIVVIVKSKSDFPLLARHAPRVRTVELRSLLYGGLPNYLRDVRRYRDLVANAKSVSIVGADIMDGAYNWRASNSRATVAYEAARAGVDTRVLGFSWNSSPHPLALAAMRRASAAGVALYLRDPLSAARARQDGLANVTSTADIVFAADSVDPSRADEIRAQLPPGAPFAIVNASGLIARSADQTSAYVRIIEHLRAAGLAVVLLPHVSKPNSDDAAACRAVYEALTDTDGVVLVETLLEPAQVRALTESARLTVTGRMHLAIMSLMNGVAPITLATQGKVEGLMQMIGRDDLCVEPGDGVDGRVIPVIDALLASGPEQHAALRESGDAARELARSNFPGVPASAGAGRA